MQPPSSSVNRREFLRHAALGGSVAAVGLGTQAEGAAAEPIAFPPVDPAAIAHRTGASTPLADCRPARWLWYPGQRCLANTVVLFCRELQLAEKPRCARGWIFASSRYLLHVNGRRIQFGPAPCDPRFEEIDPMDLTEALTPGRNAIGIQSLYYGHGDGTWPAGQPGVLFCLDIETADGATQRLVSDRQWRAHLSRAWPPGHYKRWYLRAFQEEFDARLHPHDWTKTDFEPTRDWLPARELDGACDRPSLAAGVGDYAQDFGPPRGEMSIQPRSIPLLVESHVPVKRLAEQYRIEWMRPAEEYFECLPPDAFRAEPAALAHETAQGAWQADLKGEAMALTFELAEQVVGWPYFTIEAPEGTIVELLVHEAHALGGSPLLNSHFHAWSRFVCRAGVNRFETFDFESLRWLQLHIRNATGPVAVRDVGVRRRKFPWPNEAQVRCSDPAIQRVIDASINTLYNSAQETVVDGMGRERQQYSGDGGHQLHAIYYAFGETRLPARFLRTFSQGMTIDGYFLDCWPAYDRLARVMQRQLGLTNWGPLLDHGVGFNFDCFHYLMHTGDCKPFSETYPRLVKFAAYLADICAADGLLPVENIGVPAVWIDHQAYRQQRHKHCAFNLYAAAMLENALPAIARALGDEKTANEAVRFGRSLRETAVQRYWDPQRELFVVNLPWLAEEKEARLCDRSTATAILFGQCPNGRQQASLKALAELPPSMGESYPCNANWRYWALAKGGRIDVLLDVFRRRWAKMPSVLLNNTLQEDWNAAPDSGSQWSHCAVAPLYCMFMNVAGIQPLEPGFGRCEIRPQLGDLESLELTAQTVRGPISFHAKGGLGRREISIVLPPNCEGELVTPSAEKLSLERLPDGNALARYRLPPGRQTTVALRSV